MSRDIATLSLMPHIARYLLTVGLELPEGATPPIANPASRNLWVYHIPRCCKLRPQKRSAGNLPNERFLVVAGI